MWWFRMKDMILTLMMDLDVLYDLFIMSPLNFFKGSFFDHGFKAKPAP
jgi:hypothetical protein